MAPYRELFYAPDSPITTKVAPPIVAFVAEPFYQLLRYQLMARQVEIRKADVIDSASVLYVYVAENRALRRVIVPAFRELGKDVFEVWKGILVDPESFTPEPAREFYDAVLKQAVPELAGWVAYMRDRYGLTGQ